MKGETAPAEKQATFARLLGRFRESRDRVARTEAAEWTEYRQLFKTRLKDYLEFRDVWAKRQKAFADDFNLFKVLNVEYDEVRHSRLLVWLLDRRIDHGTHAQDSLGFRLFLEELRKDLAIESPPESWNYAEELYWVAHEVSGDKSRVDIEIAARAKFIIHIENKILSVEGIEQTDREWDDLEKRRRELGISESNTHAIFLTLDGSNPKNKNFRAVGWSRIARILERFAEQAQAPEVKLFVGHYAQAVHALAASPQTDPKTKETKNGKETIP